jgi:hypothetical protein
VGAAFLGRSCARVDAQRPVGIEARTAIRELAVVPPKKRKRAPCTAGKQQANVVRGHANVPEERTSGSDWHERRLLVAALYFDSLENVM